MNTNSEIRAAALPPGRLPAGLLAKAGLLGTALLFAACIQGPWDYTPKKRPPQPGIFVTGSVIAGRALQTVCVEPVYRLNEEATSAFAFYDSAALTVSGPFRPAAPAGGPGNPADTLGQSRSLALSPEPGNPNCFRDSAGFLPVAGGAYQLEGTVRWDSAGEAVTSRFSATARVPAFFDVLDTATAPREAFTGRVLLAALSGPNPLSNLPAEIKDTLRTIYGAEYEQLERDTTGAGDFIRRNFAQITTIVTNFAGKERLIYRQRDTLFYIYGYSANSNTLSHFYPSRYSDDVQGVLVSHRFDSTAGRPQTAFDNPFGIEPDTADYYFRGSLRRLLFLPQADGRGDYKLLDSIPVVNTWFHTGLNRLYFYGYEQAYTDFNLTAIENEDNPASRPTYNVTGARGIFAGALLDSFYLYIKTDDRTKVYPMPEARAADCRDRGWQANSDCRAFYPERCADTKYAAEECREAGLRACLDVQNRVALHSADSLILTRAGFDSAAACGAGQALLDSAGQGKARKWKTSLEESERRYCVLRNLPATPAVLTPGGLSCAEERAACQETRGKNACKDFQYQVCADRGWAGETCLKALVSYCRETPRNAPYLCREADTYCAANPEFLFCKKP